MPATVPNRPDDGLSTGLLGIAETMQGMIRGKDAAEDQQRWDDTFVEGKRQFDTEIGEKQRQFDLSSMQDQQQFDANLAEGQYQFDSNDMFRKLNLDTMVNEGFLQRASSEKMTAMSEVGQTVRNERTNQQSNTNNARDNATTRRGQNISQDESRAERDARYSTQRQDPAYAAQAVQRWTVQHGKTPGQKLTPAEQRSLDLHMAEAMGYTEDDVTGEGERPNWSPQTRANWSSVNEALYRNQSEVEGEAGRQQQTAYDVGPGYAAQNESDLRTKERAAAAGMDIPGGGQSDGELGDAAVGAETYLPDIYNFDNPMSMDQRTGQYLVDPEWLVQQKRGAGITEKAIAPLLGLEVEIESIIDRHVGTDQAAFARESNPKLYRSSRDNFRREVQASISQRLYGDGAEAAGFNRVTNGLKASLMAEYTKTAMDRYEYMNGLRAAGSLGGTEDDFQTAGRNFKDFANTYQQSLQNGETEVLGPDATRQRTQSADTPTFSVPKKPQGQAGAAAPAARVAPGGDVFKPPQLTINGPMDETVPVVAPQGANPALELELLRRTLLGQ